MNTPKTIDGNAKAIEVVTRCLEEDVTKSEIVHTHLQGAKDIFIED